MSNEIVNTKHISFTEYGAEIEPETTEKEWWEAFDKLGKIESMVQFYIGDFLLFAEYKWGDKYTEMMERTGLAYQTLRHFSNVARRFPVQTREVVCSRAGTNTRSIPFTAWKAVASLSDEKAIHLLRRYQEGAIGNTDDLAEQAAILSGRLLADTVGDPDEHEYCTCPICGKEHVKG